ncbi:NADH-quinone oxidoreductase subunit J [Methylocystis sp. WRRC1]|uniref:complex I subunit 5 family protein n=1 Tax=Methylocystis sp. WRRC1 TaxID=1732014 RepID=UPI001D146541|nr:NADH-quinone oxidoreductase subunit J [Methylocystis sp. WRRC1]
MAVDPASTGASLLLPAIIILPVAAMLLAFLLGERRTVLTALAVTPIGAALAAAIAYVVWRDDRALVYVIGGWSPPLGVALRADGFSAAMLVTAALIISVTGLFAVGLFGVNKGERECRTSFAFWTLLLALWAAINGVFLGWDLFNLYVALEMLTFAAVPLVCLDGRAATLAAALRYLLFALFGSALYLLGATLLYGAYGALDIGLLSSQVRPEAAAWVALAAMTAGLLAKTALFPLHLWLPPAHAGAPPPASAMLSALVVKASFFLVLRLWLNLAPSQMSEVAAQLLAILGAGAIVFGSVLALRQARLKLLIAYSTVAQIGYLFLIFPLAVGTHPWAASAWVGGAMQAVSHAFAKAAMFLSAGLIAQALGHDRIAEFRGLGRVAAPAVLAFALGGVSLMGLPPSGGFTAKWLLLTAAIESGQWIWVLVMAAGGLLAAGYVYRVIAPALEPATNIPPAPPASISSGGVALALVLSMTAILLGFAPTEFSRLVLVGAPGAKTEFVR